MNLPLLLSALFGFALLMVVHEGGHHLVARAFKMRVLRFSIGFGPTLWRHKPKGSDTTYQVCVIPFLAYVQIDGMNPFEESDPDDPGRYENASLTARVLTVAAGPLANYFFASILFFGGLMAGSPAMETTVVDVREGGAAESAQMLDNDQIVSIDGEKIESFEQMRQLILASPDKPLEMEVLRDGELTRLSVTPEARGPGGGGLIGVSMIPRPVETWQEALSEAVQRPAQVVTQLVAALGRMISGSEGVSLAGPIGITKEITKHADRGLAPYLDFLGILSASLGGLNLLPFPALDGGRLMFLFYEAVARRKPNARVEAHIHAFGIVMFLALMIVVSVFDIRGF